MEKACGLMFKRVTSPLGTLEVSGCQQGVHGIRLLDGKTPDTDPTAAPAPRDPLDDPGEVPEPVPALHHPVFQQDAFTGQVLRKLLTAVQFGEVVSYQQLAALAGHPRASRAVGGAMRSNPVPILVPCHRVVCSSGAVGNYTGGPAVKEWLLTHEGSLAGRLARAGGTRLARASQPAGRSRVCVVGARE
uniref:Methylated-DNA--protein-cysteine methyltransferase n=1 Tax=Rousettus aegyptiacus TaxID=9407 RepID=A0A7J8GBR1_ROUAE|nr:O-6-methylguanine-DNA methyltransferase [Rousettus aegyptiacus]